MPTAKVSKNQISVWMSYKNGPIADFGGYLGLLLGYSLLGFYDTLMDLCEKLFEKCNRRENGKEEYQVKSDSK